MPNSSRTSRSGNIPPSFAEVGRFDGRREVARTSSRRFWNGSLYVAVIIAVAAAAHFERNGSLVRFNDPSLPALPTRSADEPSVSVPAHIDSTELAKRGRGYHDGEETVRDYKEAFRLYSKAARLGNAEAMNGLGQLLAEGLGTGKDTAQAKVLFEKAAAAGSSDALANLGWIHQEGIGVAQDYRLAHSWFMKAVAKGNDEAMNRVGLLYADGLGVEKDPAAAMDWFKKAAAKNNENAINNIGWFYRDAIGVAQDDTKARGYFEKAANMGNEVSAWSLSILLDEGKGGPVLEAESARWLLQAVKGGEPNAKKELAGTMEHWRADTRLEVKRELAGRGFYSGVIDESWGDAEREAANKFIGH